ncbi:MAG TPA: tetratricopeptide repeat protein [Verrucomicrobiales bacterium]|nr:tetratricopeptide repeat protein [Verrucomicrobiales bacterium]
MARLFSGLILLLLGAAGLSAQKHDPQDIFFQGYLLARDADELDQRSDFAGAYRKLLQASEVFDSLAHNHPEWSPNMVNNRRRLTREAIQRLRQVLPAESLEPSPPDLGISGARRPGAPSGIASPPRDPVQRRFEDLERQVQEISQDRDSLLNQLQQKEDTLRSAREALNRARTYEETLRHQLEQSRKALEASQSENEKVAILQAEVEDLKEQLGEANRQLSEANQRTESVLAELEEANRTIAELKRREELYLKQRREMVALIRNLEVDPSTKDLAQENLDLREQLNAAQARIEAMTGDQERSEGELVSLREELSAVRSELVRLREENARYQQEIEELRGKLHLALEDQLMQTPEPGEEEALAENVLLKQILLRQLRHQTLRQQAKDLLITELESLGAASNELSARIEEISRSAPLNEGERQLIADLTNDPELEATLAATAEAAPANLEGDALKERILRYAKAAAYDFERGHYEASEFGYEQILQFAPRHVNSICNLGLVKMRLNKVEDAQNLFRKALVYDENHSFAHYLLGITHFHLEQYEAAVAALHRSIALAPQRSEFHLYLGVIALTQHNYPAAESALQAAIDLRPTDADAHYNLAVLYATRPEPSLPMATQHYQLALANGVAPDRRMEALLTGL